MKKLLSIVLIIQFLFASILMVQANTSLVQMTMDGKALSFNIVQLKLNNKIIKSDVPPVIYNDRTLVPLRAIMENIDAEIEWDSAKYEVNLKTKDKTIVLKINSPEATVNGIKKSLPDNVPPKLINDRTMVPIRFIAEEIGLQVEWDDVNRTVLLTQPEPEPQPQPQPEIPVAAEYSVKAINVKTETDFPEIRIKTTGRVEYEEMKLINPDRLVFDIKNTLFDLDNKTEIQGNNTYAMQFSDTSVLTELRVSQFTNNPFVTRVVLQLKSSVKHQVSFDEANSEIVITFVNYVKAVKKETINTKEVIAIEGDNIANYNHFKLTNPERIVVDIKDALINHKDGSYRLDFNSNAIKSVRVSQYTPDSTYKPDDKIVRVVIDLQAKDKYEDYLVEIVNNRLIIHLEGKPYESFKYQAVSKSISTLAFISNNSVQYDVKALEGNNKFRVTVPKSNYKQEFKNITVNDHMIKNILVDETTDPLNFLVDITLVDEIEYRVITATRVRTLMIELVNKNKYRNILIVLDPGHGGTDPGAISPIRKMKESELVLEVSKRVNKMLTDVGFMTHMTRSTDTSVALQDRVTVANDMNADLYVSIHANAATNTSVNGIENLYYPSEMDPNDNRDNKKLAQVFQAEMVKHLGAFNRGIVARDKLYVIRETKMPAVLVEMGFLTNKIEEDKLSTDEYRQLVAESIYQSILKYYDEVLSK